MHSVTNLNSEQHNWFSVDILLYHLFHFWYYHGKHCLGKYFCIWYVYLFNSVTKSCIVIRIQWCLYTTIILKVGHEKGEYFAQNVHAWPLIKLCRTIKGSVGSRSGAYAAWRPPYGPRYLGFNKELVVTTIPTELTLVTGPCTDTCDQNLIGPLLGPRSLDRS